MSMRERLENPRHVRNVATGKVHAVGPRNGAVGSYASGCGLHLRHYNVTNPLTGTREFMTQASPKPYAPTFRIMDELEPVRDYAKECCHRCFSDLKEQP